MLQSRSPRCSTPSPPRCRRSSPAGRCSSCCSPATSCCGRCARPWASPAASTTCSGCSRPRSSRRSSRCRCSAGSRRGRSGGASCRGRTRSSSLNLVGVRRHFRARPRQRLERARVLRLAVGVQSARDLARLERARRPAADRAGQEPVRADRGRGEPRRSDRANTWRVARRARRPCRVADARRNDAGRQRRHERVAAALARPQSLTPGRDRAARGAAGRQRACRARPRCSARAISR